MRHGQIPRRCGTADLIIRFVRTANSLSSHGRRENEGKKKKDGFHIAAFTEATGHRNTHAQRRQSLTTRNSGSFITTPN